jgi:hypothetical protein
VAYLTSMSPLPPASQAVYTVGLMLCAVQLAARRWAGLCLLFQASSLASAALLNQRRHQNPRRKPFLIKGLEATLNKFILSLEFYDADGRAKIAIAVALVFALKLGALPENVLGTLLNDRLVAKGTVLDFVTTFFQVGGLGRAWEQAARVTSLQGRMQSCSARACVALGGWQ